MKPLLFLLVLLAVLSLACGLGTQTGPGTDPGINPGNLNTPNPNNPSQDINTAIPATPAFPPGPTPVGNDAAVTPGSILTATPEAGSTASP